jgi:hypothetical protein
VDHSSVSNNNVIHLGSFLLLYAYIITKWRFLVNHQKVVLEYYTRARACAGVYSLPLSVACGGTEAGC